MGLFSFFNKNKQDAKSGRTEYRAPADEPFTSPGGTRTRARRAGANAANSKENDPILPEKKRARRRLIGAVVLVVTVIIVLPMILDPEPRPVPDDIAIQIPSRDGKTAAGGTAGTGGGADKADGKSSDKPSADNANATSAKAPDTVSLDAREEIVDSGARPAAGTAAAVVAPVAVPALAPTPTPAATSAAAAPQVAAPEKPAAKPAAPPAPAATAPVKSEKPVEKPVEKIAEKPAEKAAPAAVRPSEEERALAILQGRPVPAAKGDSKAAAAKGKLATMPGGKFTIQVAALATQEKIDELRSKLTAAGIGSYTQKVATQTGDRTRIRVGPFATHADAEKARVRIAKLGLNATVLPN